MRAGDFDYEPHGHGYASQRRTDPRARPERLLDESVRRSQSVWGFVTDEVQERVVNALDDDLRSGAWDERYGEWRTKPFFEGSLRMIVGHALARPPR